LPLVLDGELEEPKKHSFDLSLTQQRIMVAEVKKSVKILHVQEQKTRGTFETDQACGFRACLFSYFFEAHYHLELSTILKHFQHSHSYMMLIMIPHCLECLFSTVKLLVIFDEPDKMLSSL